MPKQNTQPIHPGSGAIRHETHSTANTNRDGTGTITTIVTGAAQGTMVEAIKSLATGTTTAGMIRYFLSDDGGTTWRLFQELTVAAVTPGAATKAAVAGAADGVLTDDGWLVVNIVLEDANQLLGVATHQAEEFETHAKVGDY